MNWVDQIREWNLLRGYACPTKVTPAPQLIRPAESKLYHELGYLRDMLRAQGEHGMRVSLIFEEFEEWYRAYLSRDDIDELDGLCDLIFVLIGHALQRGLPIELGMLAVIMSNVSKGTTRDANGKLLKDPHYVPPQLAALFDKTKEST